MAQKNPYARITTREPKVPVTRPLPGQVANSTGGFSYGVDDWTRLRRFLILGTEGGSYYSGEATLTKENAEALFRCIAADGRRTVDEITTISVEGRNIKQEPVMFALAACAGAADTTVRTYALSKLPEVCRTGSHLLLFASFIEQFRGWGRGLRDAVSTWYLSPADDREVAVQVAKYQSRYGWSHKDLLALAKPQFWFNDGSVSPTRDSVLRWAAGRLNGETPHDSFLQAVDEVRALDVTKKGDLDRAVSLVEMFNLPWEVLPSELLNVPAVWHGMLPNMGIGALVRNLGRLTANGTITPMSGVENLIVARLSNEGQIRRSRIHPYSVLLGAVTYAQGRGFKGSLSWQPNGKILSALDSTFGLAFKNVEPSGKRTLVGLDVSGSMDGSRIAGSFLTAREASSAMALVTLAVEPWTATMAFSDGFVPINLHAGQSLADVVRSTRNMPFDRTDCSAPFRWATKTKTDVETFVIYTDSEVNVGTHPAAALREYRQHIGHDVKLVVVGMTANRFSIADPNDAGMLDVVGFDASAPALISDFSAGKV